MRFRCPDCDQLLEVDDRPGPQGRCPRCGLPVRIPGGASDREALWRERDRRWAAPPVRDDDEDDHPPRDRLHVPLAPRQVARWPRFISPGLMALALLTLPLPWLEVSCNNVGNPKPQFRYAQTGLQIMADRHTDLNVSPPVVASPKEPRVFRQVGTIVWAAALAAGIVLGLIGPHLACNIAHSCCAAFAFLMLPAVLLGVVFGEVFNSVTLTPWPLAAFLACFGALAGAIVTLVREWPPSLRAPPRFDDDFD